MKKEQIEESHLRSFWKTLGLYPNTLPQPQAPPEPDFILNTSLGLIGIEHTQLIHQKDGNGVDPMIHEVVGNQIMDAAEALYTKTETAKLHVLVTFRTDYGLSMGRSPISLAKTDIKTLSPFIANFVASNIPDEGCDVGFDGHDLKDGAEILPEKIESITISNTNHLNASCWSTCTGGTIPRILESSAFNLALNKKNSKPANYRKQYAEIWLLIVENDKRLTSYFDFNSMYDGEIVSAFDRVFVYRYGLDRIIELKTSKLS